MPCDIVKDGNVTAIVCGRGRRAEPRCFVAACGRPSEVQCDWEILNGKTCDRHCCGRHAKRVGPNRDYCLDHWVQAGKPAVAASP